MTRWSVSRVIWNSKILSKTMTCWKNTQIKLKIWAESADSSKNLQHRTCQLMKPNFIASLLRRNEIQTTAMFLTMSTSRYIAVWIILTDAYLLDLCEKCHSFNLFLSELKASSVSIFLLASRNEIQSGLYSFYSVLSSVTWNVIFPKRLTRWNKLQINVFEILFIQFSSQFSYLIFRVLDWRTKRLFCDVKFNLSLLYYNVVELLTENKYMWR